MSHEVTPGFYRHFEGPLYRVWTVGHAVFGHGQIERPGNEVVIYEAQYTSQRFGSNHHWVRLLSDFVGPVMVGEQTVPRFTRVPEPKLPQEGQETPILSAEPIYRDTERSIAFITLNGLNQRVVNHASTTTYEVLEGSGTVDVDGVVSELRQGTTITVSPGTPYQDEGRLVMVATSVPPFDSNMVEVVK